MKKSITNIISEQISVGGPGLYFVTDINRDTIKSIVKENDTPIIFFFSDNDDNFLCEIYHCDGNTGNKIKCREKLKKLLFDTDLNNPQKIVINDTFISKTFFPFILEENDDEKLFTIISDVKVFDKQLYSFSMDDVLYGGKK